MKVLTINGPKTASILFACLCAMVILYVGFFNDNTMAVSSHVSEPTTYVAVIVNGFGTGQEGTKEFLYMNLPFTAVLSDTGTQRDADQQALGQTHAQVIEVADLSDLNVYQVENKRNLAHIEEKLLKIIEEANVYTVLFVDLGPYAHHTAHAIQAIHTQNPHLSFITYQQLLEMTE